MHYFFFMSKEVVLVMHVIINHQNLFLIPIMKTTREHFHLVILFIIIVLFLVWRLLFNCAWCEIALILLQFALIGIVKANKMFIVWVQIAWTHPKRQVYYSSFTTLNKRHKIIHTISGISMSPRVLIDSSTFPVLYPSSFVFRDPDKPVVQMLQGTVCLLTNFSQSYEFIT